MRFQPVTRCVCTARSFRELRDSGLTSAEAIARVYGSGAGCGMCRVYIERMLATGRTTFGLIGYDEDPPEELPPGFPRDAPLG